MQERLAYDSTFYKVDLIIILHMFQFSDYFTIRRNPAPVLRVDSRRLYQVREFYLSDLGRINSTVSVHVHVV